MMMKRREMFLVPVSFLLLNLYTVVFRQLTFWFPGGSATTNREIRNRHDTRNRNRCDFNERVPSGVYFVCRAGLPAEDVHRQLKAL